MSLSLCSVLTESSRPFYVLIFLPAPGKHGPHPPCALAVTDWLLDKHQSASRQLRCSAGGTHRMCVHAAGPLSPCGSTDPHLSVRDASLRRTSPARYTASASLLQPGSRPGRTRSDLRPAVCPRAASANQNELPPPFTAADTSGKTSRQCGRMICSRTNRT